MTIPFDLKARYLDEIKIKLMMIWPQMQEFNETSGEVLYSEFIGKRISKRSEWFEKQLKVLENKNLFKMNTNFAFGIYKKCS